MNRLTMLNPVEGLVKTSGTFGISEQAPVKNKLPLPNNKPTLGIHRQASVKSGGALVKSEQGLGISGETLVSSGQGLVKFRLLSSSNRKWGF